MNRWWRYCKEAPSNSPGGDLEGLWRAATRNPVEALDMNKLKFRIIKNYKQEDKNRVEHRSKDC
jgi:hypothetical protein